MNGLKMVRAGLLTCVAATAMPALAWGEGEAAREARAISTGAAVPVAAAANTAAAADVVAADTDATTGAVLSSRTTSGADIVVTAARTVLPVSALPLTVDVIDSQSLAEQVAISGSVVDAVSTLSPSFSPTRQKLSGAGETLRGRSPLYAINGIPQSTPIRDGSRDGYTIDAFFIDRVELIYGSNALQGIGATGGVVNQVTVGAPDEDGITGRALLQGSANNDFSDEGFGGKAAGLIAWRAGAFDATVGAAYEVRSAFYDGDGRQIGVDGTQGDIQDSKSWSVFGRFGYQLGDSTRIDLLANRFELKGDNDYVVVAGDRATGLPTSAMRGISPGRPPANRVETLALTLSDTDLFGGNFSGQAFFNRSRDTFGGSTAGTFQDVSIAPVGTLFDQSANRSRKYGAKLTYERTLLDGLNATLGFDALYDRTAQSLVLTGRVWVPPTDFRSLAPFGQINLRLFDNMLRLAGGLRYESVQLKVDDFVTLASAGSTAVAGGKPTFSDALVNGGVVFEPLSGMRLYASYAEGYTVPDVGRILRAVNRPGQDVDDFLDISPIVSNNRELGFELKRGPLNASVSYFWSSSKLGQFLLRNPDGIFNVQRQRIEIEGIEINLLAQTPLDGLDVSVGYSHLTGQTDTDRDGRVDTSLDGANISPDRLNLAAIYASGPLSARIQGQFYLSRRFDTGRDFGGYALADASLRYQTRLGGVSLSVQNLFNKQYISYNSQTSAVDDNHFFAGRGRVFTLGWDTRF